MGLETTWRAMYQGHELVVSRNEWTKGFQLTCDGEELARRRWSWIGTGELQATLELDGTSTEVHVAIEWNGLGREGTCTIAVGGVALTVERTR